jgi:hypothetical protein
MERRRPLGPVTCRECATVHEAACCPTCGEQTEVVTEAGARWVVTAQRDPESGGWEPIGRFPSPVAWGGTIEDAR